MPSSSTPVRYPPKPLAPNSTASLAIASRAEAATGTEQFVPRSSSSPLIIRLPVPARAARASPLVMLPALKASRWKTIGVR